MRRLTKRKFPPVHPGVVLSHDFLQAKGITLSRLAKGVRLPPRRIEEIVQGRRGITADTALRLGKFFGMEAQFRMNLQSYATVAKRQPTLHFLSCYQALKLRNSAVVCSNLLKVRPRFLSTSGRSASSGRRSMAGGRPVDPRRFQLY